MDPKVRDLYKRFLLVGRDYPLELRHVREKVKAAFYENRGLRDSIDIKKAIKRGRWIVREMVGVIQLKKYRTLTSRYTSDDLREKLRDIEHRRSLDTRNPQRNKHKDVYPPTLNSTILCCCKLRYHSLFQSLDDPQSATEHSNKSSYGSSSNACNGSLPHDPRPRNCMEVEAPWDAAPPHLMRPKDDEVLVN
ncbi:hypothetical protein PsorP6_000557 [Peronosclerospora sorghi]|uniref:Uncharacterized protein n=1 Tax=Peronosclerospora sorghi TaxID=230839 RepID=A0ACC0WWP4_9STRA|nr:hypothetical protein PsorP6_000557 [Peronosclerospora sorghi]